MFVSGIVANVNGTIYTEPHIAEANGSKVTSVTIAQQCGYGDDKHYVFIECSFWGKDADSLMKYKPNHPISLTGTLKVVPYIDSDGNPQARLKVNPVITWVSNAHIPSQNSENKSGNESGNNNVGTQNNTNAKNPPEKAHNEAQVTQEQLQQALKYVLTKGRYKGCSVELILQKDPRYIYDIASNADYKNQRLKTMFAVAYNYMYYKTQSGTNNSGNSQQKQNQSPNSSLQGVKQNYLPKVSADTPDEDLPF